MHLLITIFLLAAALISCRSVKSGADQSATLETLANEAVGPENTIEYNRSDTFALVQEKAGSSHAGKQYRFAVVRLKDLVVVRKGTFALGHVKWLDDDSIEVLSGSTSLKEEDSSKKIIHVNSPVE